jgi:hypothetical protein
MRELEGFAHERFAGQKDNHHKIEENDCDESNAKYCAVCSAYLRRGDFATGHDELREP